MMAICPCSNMAVKFWTVPFFFKDFNYLFLERGEGKEKERERNINCLLYTSDAADEHRDV